MQEYQSAYSRLTVNQRKAIDILSDMEKEYTNVQIAELVGVSDETIARWKKDDDFLKALDEGELPGFISESKSRFRRDMLRRYKNNTTTQTDRELMAKITGHLTSDNMVQTNVQVNIKGGPLW